MIKFRQLLTIISLLVLSLLLLPPSAWGHSIVKVKGKRVLIKIDGKKPKKGQLYYLVNDAGKKKAIVKIGRVKKNRATGVVKKGKAKKGWSLVLRKRKSRKNSDQKNASNKSTKANQSAMYWGGMLGFASNSMSVTFTDGSGSVDLSGSGFSGKVLFDFALFDSIWFRGLWGMETLTPQAQPLPPVAIAQLHVRQT